MRRHPSSVVALLLMAVSCGASGPQIDFEALRREMVSKQLESRGIRNRRVLDAMARVPRENFVPPDLRHLAYLDSPLPVGYEQTISQPYIVALMSQLAKPEPDDRALEVGTGSGYQAAVLAEIVSEVYSIEILPQLAREASTRIRGAGYENVFLKMGDGYAGWPDRSPFDIILVTAAAPRVPPALVEQLADGGRLVIPLGEYTGIQKLTLLERRGAEVKTTEVLDVRFVPMTGEVQKPPPPG